MGSHGEPLEGRYDWTFFTRVMQVDFLALDAWAKQTLSFRSFPVF
jgi:hypothetical protein